MNDRPFDLLVRLDDDERATGDTHSFTGRVQLQPKEHKTIYLPLDMPQLGLLALPSGPDPAQPSQTFVGNNHGRIDRDHVVALHISGVRTDAPSTLHFGAPRLLDLGDWSARLSNLADAYGQWTHGSWPEKVAGDQDLRSRLNAAQLTIERLAHDPVPKAGRFSGLPRPAGLEATGFFRTEKMLGRWWLVTPDGYGFFSLGVDTLRAEGRTPVKGRERMFAALPQPGEELARYLGPNAAKPEWLDVREANLHRGLGPSWRHLWPRQALGRLQAWGFNTIGNWSDPSVTGLGVLPYVAELRIFSGKAVIPITERHSIADPFDPGFARAADDAARTATEGRQNDPMLLGYFGANELPWRGIGRRLMALPGHSAARYALLEMLRARYGDVSRLAAAWHMPDLGSWESLEAPLALPEQVPEQTTADLAAFEGEFAGRWFQTVAEALKRNDPNHLFLGSRFADWTPESVRACARWCDVLSFNIYARSPEQAAAPLWHALDKPILIGEFHFGSIDRGNFWPGLVDVGSEDQRSLAYANYIQAAADDPNIVGCHWFEYADEPLTGRIGDGENGHIGLVAVTDIPWQDFAAGVARANRDVLRELQHWASERR